ncbi:MAG TPA: GGDEF domain-containing protein [Candidatus Eisenbacteria bacterium]|nr:GGDEF domain-containing protein [Candidatus Eisenbacteria bacterium]
MLGRDKLLESLLELSGNGPPRTHEDLNARVLHTALQLVDADGAALVTPHGHRLERFTLGLDHAHPRQAEAPARGTDFGRLLQQVGHPIAVADLGQDPRLGGGDTFPGLDAGPAMFVPLRPGERMRGHLACYRRRGRPGFDGADARAATLLAAWTGLAVEHLRLAGTMERLAVTDDLTQVYNYRFLKAAMRREIRRASRFGLELSVVMVDVDNLKAYNDKNGHLRGSRLLREIAGLIAAQVRSFDLVAKYGGDEFTVILPQTGRAGAMAVAERIRAAIANQEFAVAHRGEITISCGVATFPTDNQDGLGLIRMADRALYAAKRRGRNCVETVAAQAA